MQVYRGLCPRLRGRERKGQREGIEMKGKENEQKVARGRRWGMKRDGRGGIQFLATKCCTRFEEAT